MIHESTEAILIPTGDSKLEIPNGLWTKCPDCKEMLYAKELTANLEVCRHCNHHFPIGARARIASLVDPESFTEYDDSLSPVDTLKFTGAKSYTDQIKKYQEKTGLKDAVLSGIGTIEEKKISLAVMDFSFLGGSMGSVVGEKITRAIERATAEKIPVIVVCASGGARMYEGMLSLMQMAKTSAALARHGEARLPFLAILTNPTMAGVTASFASLGDLIIAEPKAMVGFAGARVIKETTRQELPKGFQTSEFLLDRGLIDMIVGRHQLRSSISTVLRHMQSGQASAKK